jgi:hypothetical protein
MTGFIVFSDRINNYRSAASLRFTSSEPPVNDRMCLSVQNGRKDFSILFLKAIFRFSSGDKDG